MPNEVVVRGTVLPLTEKARDRFAQEQVDLIAASVAPANTPLATIHRFIELCARYELDPFAGEIWCALMAGRDGANGRVAILVGRDGYLKVARRDPIFIDVDADVVYEKDEFKVVRAADGNRTIEHSYGNPAQRGRPIGAYAVLRREGKPDRYFYAPLHQYAKDAEKSAWKYLDAMIVKCAVSYITRTTYGISGPVPADEINGGLALPGDGPEAAVIEGRAAEGSLLPTDLVDLVGRAHALDPKAWRENEVLARLDGTPETEQAVRHELAAWLDEHEPPDAEVVDVGKDLPSHLRGGQEAVRARGLCGEVFVQPNGEEAMCIRSAGHDGLHGDQGANGTERSTEPNGHTIEEMEAAEATDPQTRYESDEQWRTKVDVLLNRRADLEACAAEDQDEGVREEINAELDSIEEELVALDVPSGWMPVAEGQSSLEV